MSQPYTVVPTRNKRVRPCAESLLAGIDSVEAKEVERISVRWNDAIACGRFQRSTQLDRQRRSEVDLLAGRGVPKHEPRRVQEMAARGQSNQPAPSASAVRVVP